MAVFVGAGAMGLLWAAVIAMVVFVEKVLPRGLVFGRAIGAALIGGAVLVAAQPEIAQSLAGKM
jgi:predicted metal-binding membrane protein